MLYLIGIEPAWRTRARLSAELPGLRAEAAEVQALALEAQKLKGRSLALESPERLKAALARLLAENNVPADALREVEGRGLVLTVRRADAASCFAWVQQASAELALRVSYARVARAGPGLVDAEIALAAAQPR
jgi:general secretion pathway protein M